MQNGIVLNGKTTVLLLEEHGFKDITLLQPGETGFPPALINGIDLSARAEESVYIECRKP